MNPVPDENEPMNPAKLQDVLQRANRAFEFDNWEEALKLYTTIERHKENIVNIGHIYCRLGVLFHKGFCGKKDLKRAATYFSRALEFLPKRAEEGDPEAICDLGYLHNYGYGVKQDTSKAVYYYQISADKGYPRAQSNLGYMLLNGHGILPDKKKLWNIIKKLLIKDIFWHILL